MKKIFVILLILLFGCTPTNTSQPFDGVEEKQEEEEEEEEETSRENQSEEERINKSGEKEPMPTTSFRIEIPNAQERKLLPECKGKQFTTFPIDIEKVTSITPIGNLGPPGHTLPTDHPHLHVGEYRGGEAVPLFAPADIHITSVSWSSGITQDPVDYIIYFALCKDVIGYYNHVKTLSPEMERILEGVSCEGFSTSNEGSCTKVLLEGVKEGMLLGEVGHQQGNFDFGLFDLRKPLQFIKPERHAERTRYIHCPFDYYPPDMKQQLYSLIERTDGTCGGIMQDVSGTLKGAWFHEDAEEEYVVDWNVFLAFIDHFENPNVQVVSIAGIFTQPSLYEFTPQKSGVINREFTDVKADNTIYCYHSENVVREWEKKPSGKILVRMVDDEALEIEHQKGACSEGFAFTNPTVYKR